MYLKCITYFGYDDLKWNLMNLLCISLLLACEKL